MKASFSSCWCRLSLFVSAHGITSYSGLSLGCHDVTTQAMFFHSGTVYQQVGLAAPRLSPLHTPCTEVKERTVLSRESSSVGGAIQLWRRPCYVHHRGNASDET